MATKSQKSNYQSRKESENAATFENVTIRKELE